MHDSNYGTGIIYRGNVSQSAGPNGRYATCYAYDTAGIAVQTIGPTGTTVAVTTDTTTNYSLPATIRPNGNSNMQTSVTYASSFAVWQVINPNGVTSSATYDTWGRPLTSTVPDTAQTSYTYAYYSDAGNTAQTNTQTAKVNGRWKVTTLDGFGRVVQVDSGHDQTPGNNPVSRVTTLYAPCACSPLGKAWAVSQPYVPGYLISWTTYTYDALGRTTNVLTPDGASHAQSTYAGNSTTVTDPAGKWKTSTVDVFGNLTLLTEPNPAGGANLTTSYTYSPLNQLVTVSMSRGSLQQRSFGYQGVDLVTAQNPENGTVTYVYNKAHQVTGRTDAKGQQTVYNYDTYGRLTKVQYYPTPGTEDTHQQVNYAYDAGANGWGHMTGVTFNGNDDFADTYTYSFTYSAAGRVSGKVMNVQQTSRPGNVELSINFAAAYTWDNEGRLSSMQSPTITTNQTVGYSIPTGTFAYSYDQDGRLNAMAKDSYQFATADYTPAGQLAHLTYPGANGSMMKETRNYNALMQLTSQSMDAPGYLNMTYNYSGTQNNGRITGSVDGITLENTTYSYDALNRLTGATNSLWSEAYSYDGFGNLTSKVRNGQSVLNVSFDANNHQVNTSYDANGNPSGPIYNVENRRTQAGGGSGPVYTYDPMGKRVMTEAAIWGTGSNNYQYSFYGIGGERLVTVGCTAVANQTWPTCAVLGQNVYFGGKLLVSNGVGVVTDRLGSVRGNTQGERFAYYPYGDERTSTPDGRDKFGTYFRDGVGQDYADQRYYGVGSGRFWGVDPSTDSASANNPTSLNRYAYTNGDPVNFFDPDGLATCSDSFFTYNGHLLGTVADALALTSDVTILAETEYTEAGHSGNTNSKGEEDMIGEVIMNRWALVNGYLFLYPVSGRPAIDVSAWGQPGGGLTSVAQGGQFAVWNGSSLAESAQANLDEALNSAATSRECDDLSYAIGSAIAFLSTPQVNIYYATVGGAKLVPLGFNSGHLRVPGYMRKIGSFGDSNVFYGAPLGEFSQTLMPIIRPKPPRSGPGQPRKGGPMLASGSE